MNEFTKAIWPAAYSYQLTCRSIKVNQTKFPIPDWVMLAKAGDVFRVDGWYDSSHKKFIEEVLAAADKL